MFRYWLMATFTRVMASECKGLLSCVSIYVPLFLTIPRPFPLPSTESASCPACPPPASAGPPAAAWDAHRAAASPPRSAPHIPVLHCAFLVRSQRHPALLRREHPQRLRGRVEAHHDRHRSVQPPVLHRRLRAEQPVMSGRPTDCVRRITSPAPPVHPHPGLPPSRGKGSDNPRDASAPLSMTDQGQGCEVPASAGTTNILPPSCPLMLFRDS